MKNINWTLRTYGGIAATHELLKEGHTSHELTAAVRRGEILRLRQGHYASTDLSIAQQEAFRVGGRLTGVSGARHYNMWAPPSAFLEVVVKRNATELRDRSDPTKRLGSESRRTGIVVIWTDDHLPGTRSVVTPLECVLHIARTRAEIDAFASAESALHRGHFSRMAWIAAVARLPRRLRRRLGAATRHSESGGESMAKLHFMDLRLIFEQQRKFPNVGRVDFLIGERLVIEIDGAEFHTSVEQFEEDRRRDAVLSALGYRVLRFSYRQVERRWPEVEAAINAAIARGDHRA
jgi:very-short-patch-repair endonuclease